jgi:cell division GTPase FtsZ
MPAREGTNIPYVLYYKNKAGKRKHSVEERIMAEQIPGQEPIMPDVDLVLPDIPELEQAKPPVIVEDTFKSAVQFAFLGIGHGGSRIVESFWALGYRRACVVNTAIQDLNEIKIPEENKKCIGIGGAAKNRRVGENAVQSSYEDVMDLMRRSYGTAFDRIMVCATAGGGTGSGGFEMAIKIANDLSEERRIKKVGDSTRVGLLIALPSNSERDRMGNAWEAMKTIEKLRKDGQLSPIVIVDNERINQIFRSATIGNVWDIANKSITTMFHLFNQIAVAPTRYTAFDPADYRAILDSGLVTYGTLPINGTSKDELAKTVRENLDKNILTGGMNIHKATISACLLVGRRAIIESLPAENVDHAYEMLGRMIGGGIVHRGIYSTERALSAFTLIGGLAMPKERLDEISKMSGKRDWDE